jgi:O-succinylbenzoic acid--CoA ligase
VPLEPRAPENDRLVAGVDPQLVVRSLGDLPDKGKDVAPGQDFETEDPHCLIHTSGTGGDPTAVELTYGNHLWSAIGAGVRIGVAPTDRWLCCMPLHHIGGLSIVVRCALYRIPIVLEPFETGRTGATIERDGISIVSLVPTMLGRLLDAGAPLGRLRCAVIGGAAAPRALIERALGAGAPVAPTYGLTETASQVATMPPAETAARPDSAGPPILSTEVRIDDDGRICVRGPTVAPAAANADGWLVTGDLGRVDEDGYLYVLGRADDVIVTGGENVSPVEVEEALLQHPRVTDVGVAGRDDPEWQHAVVAYVVVAPDGDRPAEDELREFCKERLAPYKVPKEFVFVTELPRNAQGKLQRSKLG